MDEAIEAVEQVNIYVDCLSLRVWRRNAVPNSDKIIKQHDKKSRDRKKNGDAHCPEDRANEWQGAIRGAVMPGIHR